MDIQIVRAELSKDGQFITVFRDITDDEGRLWRDVPERFPKQTLAIRAAEYDLEINDPRVLDQILLENFYKGPSQEQAPLYSEPTIKKALAKWEDRVESLRVEHGAPEEPQMRSLFHAADLDASTQGLTDAKNLFLEHADPNITLWVKLHRDKLRDKLVPRVKKSLTETLKGDILADLVEEAKIEEGRRQSDKTLRERLLSGNDRP